MEAILPYITLGSAFLMIVAVLLQQRGASLGAGFGASGELFTTRRGFDKNLFDATIVFAVIFVVSILASMLLPGLKG
ncbi:MAG: preprotein translocase subunit SecG [Candidatus Saccharibacteria bacterium]|nr:preprotein translocase subunit SecG [Candidatus Saccharibacteria bacterium]